MCLCFYKVDSNTKSSTVHTYDCTVLLVRFQTSFLFNNMRKGINVETETADHVIVA